MMTPQEASRWLEEKDSLEPDERLTPVGITVGNPTEDNMKNQILQSFNVGDLENSITAESIASRLENEDAGQQTTT